MGRVERAEGFQKSQEWDVVVVGAGPAGSRLAYQLAGTGHDVLIVDKAAFPRHRIGESLTGECGKMLREMGLEPQMKAQRFPVKAGVFVSGPSAKANFYVPVQDRDEHGQLGPRTTWQVRRPEFDVMLLEAAKAAGAVFLQAEARDVLRHEGTVTGITAKENNGRQFDIKAKFVVDATGYSTFLCKKRVTGRRNAGRYAKQVAVFAQFENVDRSVAPETGDTVIYYGSKDNWAWSIPLEEGITSIGCVQPVSVLKQSGFTPEAFMEQQLRTLHPRLAEATAHAVRVTETWKMANYSYRIDDFAGNGFLCIGDAHRFLDPIFSFGVYMGMKEADMAATAISKALATPQDQARVFDDFKARSDRAQGVLQNMINTFWDYPLVFLRLAHYTHRDELTDIFAGRVFDDSVEDMEIVQIMGDLMRNSISAHG